MKGYYLGRWELFLNLTLAAVTAHQPFPTDDYSAQELAIGQAFSVDTNTTFATAPVGNTAEISETLQHKYGVMYTSPHSYTKRAHTDSRVNLLTAAQWTKDVSQLQLLCDLDDHCAGFTSLGWLKRDVSGAAAVYPHEGVDLYIKNA